MSRTAKPVRAWDRRMESPLVWPMWAWCGAAAGGVGQCLGDQRTTWFTVPN